jgi:hypothetical protein
MRFRVSAFTTELLASALETVEVETPARRAISAICNLEGRCAPPLLAVTASSADSSMLDLGFLVMRELSGS